MSIKIRNICTIAHVDHGKTTLVDHLFRQSGLWGAHQQKAQVERIMDSQDLEKERGITISAKNAAFFLDDIKVNIVDTPGHADFSGEVERIMGMVDSAILLVDAAEGPLPQTRFVLERAIANKLKVIVCINKVDRPEVQEGDLIEVCENKVFDLFVELGASEEQLDFPIVYACAKDGWCTTQRPEVGALVTGESEGSMKPLFELILTMPEPQPMDDEGSALVISDLSYSEFVGALALGRVRRGRLRKSQSLVRYGMKQGQAVKESFVVTKLFAFQGTTQTEVSELVAGDIGLVAGCESFEIGDTVGTEGIEPLARVEVESPTMRMMFSINTSPFSGREGKPLQSRELRERLLREVRGNPALRLEETAHADQFYLHGRGELQFGIIIETMRREGFEFMVGRPGVLFEQDEAGQKCEPFEKLILDLPEAYSGDVTRLFQERRGTLALYENLPGSTEQPRIRLTFEIPTRGILGMRSHYLTLTRGAGLMSSEWLEYRPHCGPIYHRTNGSLISDRLGQTTAYALFNIQARGTMFVGEGVDVYEGMIIGEGNKENDLNVNVCRAKKLTNIRTQGSDGLTILAGTRQMSLEDCLEWIDDDEWIEITPQNIRLRKKVLPANERSVKKKSD